MIAPIQMCETSLNEVKNCYLGTVQILFKSVKLAVLSYITNEL